MARADQMNPPQELERLLDRERDSLLAGRLGALAGIGQEKERLFARLAQGPGSARDLERLRTRAERNQALLAAAARGIRAAQDKLGAAPAAAGSMRTYGRNGTAREIGNGPASGVNHRA